MKVIWEARDISGGRVAGKPQRRERWMIGYMAEKTGHEDRWTLTSLSDGMVLGPYTQERIADTLNGNGDLPIEMIQDEKD